MSLSLKPLVGFLTELCEFSHHQLTSYARQMMSVGGPQAPAHTSLLLYRLGDIMAHCIATERPQLHLMRVWSVAASHFVEVFASAFLLSATLFSYITLQVLSVWRSTNWN